MKKLLAVLAALPLLAACTEKGKSDPSPIRPAAKTEVAAPAPVKTEVAAVVTPDAGTKETPPEKAEPEKVNVLLAPHEDPDGEVDHVARADAMEQDDPAGAMDELRRAIFDDPEDEDALHKLAKLARGQKKLELAEAALNQLADVESDDPQPLETLARVQLEEGKNDEALQSCTEAITRDTGDAEAYHLRGRAYLAQGKLREAIDSFKGATQLDPGHAYAFNNLGYSYLLAGEYTLAEQALVSAATLSPDVAMIQNNLGLAEEKLGKIDAARAAYAKAILLKPGYAVAHVNLGRVGNVAEADTVTDANIVPPDASEMVGALPDGGVAK